jgi:hypothetical protein
MNIKVFLSFKAIISLGFGIISLCIPTIVFPYYAVQLNPAGVVFSQWFGAMGIGVGLICWFARTAERSALRQSILLSLFICDTIGFGVALAAQLQGQSNMLGWSNVALWLILALGLCYFRFIKKVD